MSFAMKLVGSRAGVKAELSSYPSVPQQLKDLVIQFIDAGAEKANAESNCDGVILELSGHYGENDYWSNLKIDLQYCKLVQNQVAAPTPPPAASTNVAGVSAIGAAVAMIALLLFLFIGTAHAQNGISTTNFIQYPTNLPPLTTGTFVTSTLNYFTGFDTNSTTFDQPVDMWTAENYRGGLNSSAELGLSYDLWKPSPNIYFSGEGVVRNAGIAGTIVGEQGGIGLSLRHYDVKVTGYVDAGYSEFDHQGFVEVGLRVKKALTANTYAGIGIAVEKLFGHSHAASVNTTDTLPTFTAYLGATLPGW